MRVSVSSSSTADVIVGAAGERRAGVRWCETCGIWTPPSVVSATGEKPFSRSISRTTRVCAWDTTTVGAMRLSWSAASPRSASMVSSTVVSSLRMYAETEPTRVWPWRRATSPTRYSSGWGTGVRLASCNAVRTCAEDHPASRPRRMLSGEKR